MRGDFAHNAAVSKRIGPGKVTPILEVTLPKLSHHRTYGSRITAVPKLDLTSRLLKQIGNG